MAEILLCDERAELRSWMPKGVDRGVRSLRGIIDPKTGP